MRKIVAAGSILVVCGIAGIAIAGGDWSGTERKVEEFKSQEGDLRKLTPKETQSIVTAICDAEEADRKSAGSDAGRRVKDKVASEFRELETLKNDSVKMCDAVMGDSGLSKQHSQAGDLKKDVLKRWESIEKMTSSVRGANHPVVSYMLTTGQQEHLKRQQSSSKCDEYEFSMSSGRVDCLKISGSTCYVIEFKPNNRTSLKKGIDQVKKYAEELNQHKTAFTKLIEKNSKFAQCKSFQTRIDCYTLCPDIDSNGNFQAVSASWDEKC